MQEVLVEDFIAEMFIWNPSTKVCIENSFLTQQQLEEKLLFLLPSHQINTEDYR